MNATRIISLSVGGEGNPIIPGANRVSKQNNQFWIGLKAPVQAYKCWIEFPFATAHLDEFGEWLVAAETEADLDVIGSGVSLDEFVDDTPQNWSTYNGHNENISTGPPQVVLDNLSVNKGILTALAVVPFPVGIFSFIGMQASVISGCGTLMRPEEIQATTQWYGTEPELQLMSEVIIPIKKS